jgi:hypothetical protein
MVGDRLVIFGDILPLWLSFDLCSAQGADERGDGVVAGASQLRLLADDDRLCGHGLPFGLRRRQVGSETRLRRRRRARRRRLLCDGAGPQSPGVLRRLRRVGRRRDRRLVDGLDCHSAEMVRGCDLRADLGLRLRRRADRAGGPQPVRQRHAARCSGHGVAWRHGTSWRPSSPSALPRPTA